MRSFLKWAGNKYRIINHLQRVLPCGKRLIEPFVGSGAVFLNTDYQRSLLSDTNADLINLYNILKTDSQSFIDYARQFFDAKNNTSDVYYENRDKFNQSDDPWLRSALFLYLNRHAYNGLCRYNSSGEFNVPFGLFKKPYFPEREMLYFSKQAKKARFKHQDFVKTMTMAKQDDIVYCDPPYVPLSNTASFTTYSKQGFGEAQQIELAQQAEKLAKKSITVVISNHDTDFTRELYNKAQLIELQVKRHISCNASNRGHASELIAIFN